MQANKKGAEEKNTNALFTFAAQLNQINYS